ncbi:unnamed protein product, partial [Ectocarpus sp. 6 AP-2014]
MTPTRFQTHKKYGARMAMARHGFVLQRGRKRQDNRRYHLGRVQVPRQGHSRRTRKRANEKAWRFWAWSVFIKYKLNRQPQPINNISKQGVMYLSPPTSTPQARS